jgi:hypothetical protein
MKMINLTAQEEAETGFTHKFIVPLSDFAGVAATTLTIDLMSVRAGHAVTNAACKVVTNLDGGATSATTLELGYDLASGSDDPNAFIEAISVHADGTPIAFGLGNGAAFATKLTGYVFLENATIDALFTATGANLSVLTQGEVHIYIALADLTKI